MENVAYIVESCIVSHVADADDLACENIERTCKHDVVVFFDSVQDRSGCGAFRNFKNSYSVGIAAVEIQLKSGSCNGLSGGCGDFGMACKDPGIIGNVVNSSPQAIDIADRHGIWKPFFFIIMCKGCEICVERSNGCLSFSHCLLCIAADYNKGKSRRCGYHLL